MFKNVMIAKYKIGNCETCRLYMKLVRLASFTITHIGSWFFVNSIIPYPVRSYLCFSNKKCRIYTACGVLQTPE